MTLVNATGPARSATSRGSEKRPVTEPAAALSATSWGVSPVAPATVCATPPSPSHSAVPTGPGLTVLTLMPRGPSSLDNPSEKPAAITRRW